ncbi:MAG: SDR family oxidoreductase, partial [Pseudomonadota bacterium]
MDVTGKIVVVTGAAGGIGRALAQAFATHGAAHVVVADVQGGAVEETARAIGGTAIVTDLSQEAAIQHLIQMTEAQIGPIDIFCSNAGIMVYGGAEVSDDEWERIWQINLMAHVWAARHVVPRMVARGGGYLLNTASAAGLLSQIGSAPYSVTKHAAVGLAEWLRITHGDDGIGVSVLCP